MCVRPRPLPSALREGKGRGLRETIRKTQKGRTHSSAYVLELDVFGGDLRISHEIEGFIRPLLGVEDYVWKDGHY